MATRPTAAAGFFLFWHASPIEGGEFHPVKLADNQFVLGLGSDREEESGFFGDLCPDHSQIISFCYIVVTLWW